MENSTEVTQEQALGLPRAGLLRRLAALLYDAFLVGAIWMLLGYAVQFVFGPEAVRLVDGAVETDPLQDAVLFTLMVASAFGFYYWFWTHKGQTLGMVAWRLKLETETGGAPDLRQALIRFLVAWAGFFCFLFGFLWCKIDRDGDTLHDKLSHTRVVVVPKSQRPF